VFVYTQIGSCLTRKFFNGLMVHGTNTLACLSHSSWQRKKSFVIFDTRRKSVWKNKEMLKIGDELKWFNDRCENIPLYSIFQCSLIFSTLVLIRHVWQLKTVVFIHWCILRVVPLTLVLKKWTTFKYIFELWPPDVRVNVGVWLICAHQQAQTSANKRQAKHS